MDASAVDMNESGEESIGTEVERSVQMEEEKIQGKGTLVINLSL